MTTSICFQNKNELDLRGLITFGASVKENNNPIGYFGTGLKYAIATLLRYGFEVTIYVGLSEVPVKTKSVTMRGASMKVVTYGNQEAPYTIELGKYWKFWQAYRELASNCRDEPDHIIAPEVLPKKGYTTIVVRGDNLAGKLKDEDIDSIFLDTVPLFTLNGIEVHPTAEQSKWIYYRGIRVFKLNKPALYNYNITEAIELTEDRTLPSLSEFYRLFAKSLSQCEFPSFIRQALEADQRYFESTIDYNWWHFKPGQVFNQIVSKYISSHTSFNTSARKLYRQDNPKDALPESIQRELIPIQKRLKVSNALTFWGKLGTTIPYEAVIITKQISGSTKAKTINKTVYITLDALDKPQSTVTGMIYKYWCKTKPKLEQVDEEDLLLDTLVDFGTRILDGQQ